ncbi:MAG: hypothetical protein ILP09_02670 [Oscillospiraceae bacterium]|nr:hypothetical protein [Oscillospiraceae bacterium]
MNNRRRITVFAIISAVLIAVSVLLALVFTNNGGTAELILPDTQQPSSGSDDPGAENAPLSAEVTPRTVQAVIRTLSRPDSYSRSVVVESSWEGGSAQYRINSRVKGGKVRLSVESDGWDEVKNILLTEDEITVWYGSDTSLRYTAPRPYGDSGPGLGDELGMIPTYEDVLELDPDRINDAAYVQRDGWKIMVATTDEITGYDRYYYVSVDTGLLEAAEAFDGERRVYLMQAGAAELNAPDDSLFIAGEEG